MSSRGRVRIGVIVLAVVVAVATAWYSLIEGFDVVEAVYQAVTTISTVGFREVRPLDTSGQIFTIFVILVGVGAMFYTATSVFEEIIEDQVGRIGRRRMERRIAALSDHAIVCGYGRVGRIVARLLGPKVGVVVIDNDPERIEWAAEAGLPAVEGDATEDGVLARAGLERAALLVAALPTDADNLYVVLSGRADRPELHIVARARAEASEAKLVRAGADRVINPQEIGARRMAAFALQPAVSEFLDVVMHGAGSVEFRLEELEIGAATPLVGLSIREAHIRDTTGAMVLALTGPGQPMLTNPGPETVLEAGTKVIAIGTDEQLAALHAYVEEGARRHH